MLECGFKSQLGLEFLGFSMWPILKLVIRAFLWVLRFPPLLHWLIISADKMKQNNYNLNSVKINSWVVPLYHVAHMLYVISAWCVACDLHTISPWPLEHTFWRQLAVQWGDWKKSWIAPFTVIIIIVIFIAVINVDKGHSSREFWDHENFQHCTQTERMLLDFENIIYCLYLLVFRFSYIHK